MPNRPPSPPNELASPTNWQALELAASQKAAARRLSSSSSSSLAPPTALYHHTMSTSPSPHAAIAASKALAAARGDDQRKPRTPGGGFRIVEDIGRKDKRPSKPGQVTLIQYPAPKRSMSRPLEAAEVRKPPPPFAGIVKTEEDAAGERLPSPPAHRSRVVAHREPYKPRGAQAAHRPLPGIAEWVGELASTLGETGSSLRDDEKATIVADNRLWADALVRRSTMSAGMLRARDA